MVNKTVFVGVGAVIEKDGKFLLVQEKKKAVRGLWNLPAGRVHKGEKQESALIREVREETGFNIEIAKYLGIRHRQEETSVKHTYKAKIVGGKMEVPEDEIMDVRWFSYDEILDMKEKLRNPGWIIGAIKEAEQK